MTDPPWSGSRLYLDTADWRLYAAGRTLELDVYAGRKGAALTLRDARTGQQRASVTGLDGRAEAAEASGPGEPPERAGDLPPGPAWDPLRSVLEDRHLLVQLRVDVREQRLAVCNGDGKTTVRVALTRYSLCRHNLRFATVMPVRGYDRWASQIEAALVEVGLEPSGQPLIGVLLSAAGRPEPGANLGPGVPLERTETAARATGAVLERLRSHVLTNEEGVRRRLDTEFLHDYRVAIRRARSIVRRSARVLPPDLRDNLAGELKWLGGLTSLPRDLDVHLEEMEGRDEPEIEPLRARLAEQREEAQHDLVEALDSDRYKLLLDQWESVALDPPDWPHSHAGRPAGEVVDDHIARAFNKVLKKGRLIHADSPGGELHDLRKRAKELRYLLECFQSLYPDDERTPVVKELKLLQDNLGEFQDCQVQQAALHTMAEDLMERRAAPAATLMTLGRLAEDLARREQVARDEFEARFARFSSPENEERYEELVHHVRKIAG